MVKTWFSISIVYTSVFTLILTDSASGQILSREEAIVQTSTTVLDEVMAVPLKSIPASLLSRAHGIAIFPRVVKGGFIIGVRHGSGVLLVRDDSGAWHAPAFATITGGNIGFQAGIQATDVVLVFTTRRSVQQILTRQFSIGVDAAAAAGPVGRQASAATDSQLQAEIYSYSRSRGLFAGVSIDGSVIQIDSFANAAYYHTSPQGQALVPASASTLVSRVMAYTGNVARAGTDPYVQTSSPLQTQPTLAIAGMSEADQLRDQLRRTAPELYERLNPEWNAYLTLPAAVFAGQSHPQLAELQASIARFDQVAADPRYRELQAIPQFQSTYGLLKHYRSTLAQDQAPLQLPRPPVSRRQPVR